MSERTKTPGSAQDTVKPADKVVAASPPSPAEDPGWALFEASLAAGAAEALAAAATGAATTMIPPTAAAATALAAPASSPTAASPTPVDQGWGVFDKAEAAAPTTSPTAGPAIAPAASPTPVDQGWGLFDQAAAPTAAGPAAAPSVESYLLCEDAGQSFAVPVRHVRRIVSDRETGVLPTRGRGPSPVVALGDDGVLPLVDLVAHMGHPGANHGAPSAVTAPRSLVVCERGDRRFVLRVERVTQVVEIEADALQETQALPAGQRPRPARFVTKLAGRTVLVLDLERLVPST